MNAKAVKGKPDRDTMLANAEALFVSRGFGPSSLRDVLAAMRCSTTAFYARFGSKEEVFVALVYGFVEDLQREAAETLGRVRSIDEGFEKGIEMLIGVLAPRKGLVALMLTEGAALPEVREVLRTTFEGLAAIAHRQFELLGAARPRDSAWALVGAIHLHVFRWAVLEDLDDDGLRAAINETGRALVR